MTVNRRKIKTVLLFVLAAPFLFTSCWGGRGVVLAPPDWIIGTWQSGPDAEYGDYVTWTFTADNAGYEYHDPAGGVDITMDLRTDFSDVWVRDGVDASYKTYWIIIDGDGHYFRMSYDEETEVYDESLLQYYLPASATEDRSWELVKQ